jgi:glycerol-3-phosphate dehydrogenase (NAD(P)+)
MPSSEQPTQVNPQKVAILGAGSWGSALAYLLARNGHQVTLWDRKSAITDAIAQYHTNSVYLPNVFLPESVGASSAIAQVVKSTTDWVIVAVASSGMRSVMTELESHLAPGCGIISATKGLEEDSALTMTEVIALVLGETEFSGLVALSGPNLAGEVVRQTPSVAVAASDDPALARRARELMMSPGTFRVYTGSDVRGVELGGALKNVLAVGAGLSDGLGFGDNTKAALMTRGLMEMSRLGHECGAKPMTFLGLAGVGDLMATASSKLSRNYRVGVGLAQGKTLEDVLAEIGQVAEGVGTARAAQVLTKRYGVETPLLEAIYDVLFLGKSPASAVAELMSRPARDE